jgi:hypothetical protein
VAPLFDEYVFVDWSAANRPTGPTPRADAIWIGSLGADGAREDYRPTRIEAHAYVRDLLVQHLGSGRRVLVGFDFPYGYPRGLASALALGGLHRPWREVWNIVGDLFQDSPANASNRFGVAHALNHMAGGGPGPFWGCPPSRATARLTSRRDGHFAFPLPVRGGPLERLRTTERGIAVQEAWKLLGAGSVVSQAITGIPYVRRLRDDPALAPASLVWPFETGFARDPRPDGPCIVHAEIWPGIVAADLLAAAEAAGEIRDRAQVRLMCRWARDEDAAGRLGAWLDRPDGLGEEDARAAEEEGWILGRPWPPPAP